MARRMLISHLKVLMALDEKSAPFGEYCVNFKTLTNATGMSRQEVRRIVRHLARKGMAEFHKGLWSEAGEVAGAGYCITKPGQAIVRLEAA
jgi:transcription initiation factor IIE alpha subunit